MSSVIKLCDLSPGSEARILSLNNEKKVRERLMDLGFYPGARVGFVYSSLFGDPSAYSVQNAVIALRRCEAENISVMPI